MKLRCAMCRREITGGYVIEERYGRVHFCSEECVKDYEGSEDISRSEHEAMFSELVDDVEMEARRLCV